MLPSIFGESLFDDWFDFPFRGFESDVDHKLYGKHAARVMKTDLKEHDEGYELKVDLPGFKKDQIDLQLQNGERVCLMTGLTSRSGASNPMWITSCMASMQHG